MTLHNTRELARARAIDATHRDIRAVLASNDALIADIDGRSRFADGCDGVLRQVGRRDGGRAA